MNESAQEPVIPNEAPLPRRLRAEHVANARLIAHRDYALRGLKSGGVCAEVGTWEGTFSRAMLDACHPRELHLFDLTFVHMDQQRFEKEIESGIVHLHEGDSSTLLETFPDEYFDWLYIDGDHRYEGVVKDINVAKRKVKRDGMLVFNDYTPYCPEYREDYGIMRAVNDLCLDDNWEIVYLAMSGLGYHDVGLRRMRP